MSSDKFKDSNVNTKPTYILPATGELYYEAAEHLMLCQPHLMPLKTLNLKKLDKLQKEADKAWMEYKKKAQQE